MSTAGEAAVRDFLRRRLPDYAAEHVHADWVDWEWLLDNKRMLSTGERAILALAGHMDARPGIVTAMDTGPMAPAISFVACLLAVDLDCRLDALAVLLAVVEGVPA